jgi:phosphate transport system permease protein
LIRRSSHLRRIKNFAAKVLSASGAILGIFFLGWILFEVVSKGANAINWSFFTMLPPPPGIAIGGVANAIVGTLWMTLLATLLAVPIGILTGTYLSELGRQTILATWVRFVANSLIGIPSIVVGLFVYASLVVTMGQFSGYAGAASLAIIRLPALWELPNGKPPSMWFSERQRPALSRGSSSPWPESAGKPHLFCSRRSIARIGRILCPHPPQT